MFQHSSWYLNTQHGEDLSRHKLFQHSNQYLSPQLLVILSGPVFDEVQSGSLALTVIQQADPERRQRTDDLPWPSISSSHLDELLEPDFREDGGQVVLPVLQGGPLTYTQTAIMLSGWCTGAVCYSNIQVSDEEVIVVLRSSSVAN